MSDSKSVKRTIWIDASVERVWRALTEKEELLRWYTWDCEIDFREGGTGKYNHGWGAWSKGRFEEIVEFEKFVLRTGEYERTITTLTPEKGGVTVAIEYEIPQLENEHATKENMSFGTYQFMRNLKSVIEQNIDLRATFWKSWIGVKHTSVRSDSGELKGSAVYSVENGTLADKEGIVDGDIIIGINDETINSYEELERKVTQLEPKHPLSLKVRRSGKLKEIRCETIPYPRDYRMKVEW